MASLPTAAQIVEFILKHEPAVHHAETHSLFDALKEAPENRPRDAEDWAALAVVELENRELIWEVTLNSMEPTESDEDEALPEELAFIQVAMSAMEAADIRQAVGLNLAQHADKIRNERETS